MAGLTKKTFEFLKGIKLNNNRDWLEANRPLYEASKKEMETLTEAMLKEMLPFEPLFAATTPKSCLFRLNRDVRFSADKSPYKTAFGSYMSPNGKNAYHGGYYLHVEPGNCFVAAGVWMPQGETIAKIRQEIDYNADQLIKIIENKSFKANFSKIEGEQLKKAPKGYDPTHPAIDLLRYKSWTVSHKFTLDEMLQTDFSKSFGKLAKQLKPFNDFFTLAIEH